MKDIVYNKLYKGLLETYQIFQNFFGEELVDLQGIPSKEQLPDIEEKDLPVYSRDFGHKEGFILVRFPKVRITNEHDKFVDIEELYAKVVVDYTGKLLHRFGLNRAKYPINHLYYNYMHSHVGSIPFGDLKVFQIPCTGSGPINNTMGSLMAGFDKDLWGLFCLELSKYVTVESIAGVPYHRLEGLNGDTSQCISNIYTSKGIPNPVYPSISYSRFIIYLLKCKDCKFNFIDGKYGIAMSDTEFILWVSNKFIEWINIENSNDTTYSLLNKTILMKAIFFNNKLYSVSYMRRTATYSQYNGKVICKFKGKEVLFTIDECSYNENNELLILNINLITNIYNSILNTINYNYGKERKGFGVIQANRYI